MEVKLTMPGLFASCRAQTPIDQAHRALIADLAARGRLPAIYGGREFIESSLIFYGPSFPDIYRRSATYVDKILKGAKPADLPVEQPIKFEMMINLKAARAIGLDVPLSLQQRADEVIGRSDRMISTDACL